MRCEICRKRKANVIFTDSYMGYIHGFTRKICRQCFIELIENEIKKYKNNLKKQKEILKDEEDKDIENRIKIATKAIKEIKADPKEMKKLGKMYKEQTGKEL